MNPHLHLPKIQLREFLSWMALTLSILLFTVTLAVAQNTTPKSSGKIHIRMEKEENGKKTSMDTTFDAGNMEQAQRYLEELSGAPVPPVPPASPKGPARFRFHHHSFDTKDSAAFQEEMLQLQEEMKDLQKQLREMHIEVFSDSGWVMPPIPPVPNSLDAEAWSQWGKEFEKNWEHPGNCSRVRVYGDPGNAEVIILDGEENEIIEKALKDGEGSKVIIIQRHASDGKGKSKEKSKEKSSGNKTSVEKKKGNTLDARLEYYPNPGNGRFKVSFKLEKKGDTSIQVFDPSGKEVYSEKLEDFSGEYANDIDISGKGKGAYLLKVTQGGKSMTGKIVVE